MRRFGSTMLVAMLLAAPTFAQFGGGGMGGGGMGGGGFGGGGMGGGGVFIDAEGVIRVAKKGGKAGRPLSPDLRDELARRADVRQVSLKQLDKAPREALAKSPNGESLPEEVQHVAGLFRIDYVIIDRAAKDVLLCGPAEGWTIEADGRAIGRTSKRPALHLADVAAAFRCVLRGDGEVRCSIDPQRDGLAAMKKYEMPSPTGDKLQAESIRKAVEQNLGLQVVTTGGVPAGSRFARALVDADYRMKRMAMGFDKFAGLFTHLDAVVDLNSGAAFKTTLARWWFTAAYDGVASDPSGTVFQFQGPGMKLLNEEVFVDENGNRRGSGQSSADWDKFSQSFTKLLPKMEEKIPAFADLHNLYDLTYVAGLVKKQGAGEWLAETAFLDEKVYSIPSLPTPKYAEPAVNFRLNRKRVQGASIPLLSVALGGVAMRPADMFGNGASVKVDANLGDRNLGSQFAKQSSGGAGSTIGAAAASRAGSTSVSGDKPVAGELPAKVSSAKFWWADVPSGKE